MLDITVIFSIIIVSFFISKYISNMDIEEKYKNKDISFKAVSIYICFFVLCLIGIFLKVHLIKIISLVIMIIIAIREFILSIICLENYNKEFKMKVKDERYSVNVGKIKKEMICSSFKNVFDLLSFPFIILEKGIYFVLNAIFK